MIQAESLSEQKKLAQGDEYVEFNDTWLNKSRFIQKVSSGKFILYTYSEDRFMSQGLRESLEEAM